MKAETAKLKQTVGEGKKMPKNWMASIAQKWKTAPTNPANNKKYIEALKALTKKRDDARKAWQAASKELSQLKPE